MCNLPPAQRLAVMDKFKKKIREQVKENQGTRTNLTSSPNGEKVKSTHTDKEIERIYDIHRGGDHGNQYVMAKPNNSVLAEDKDTPKSQKELAEVFGVSVDTLQNYKLLAEKYRSLYEKQAKERQGTRTDLKNNFDPNLAQSKTDNRVNTKLSQVAGVGKETYRMGAKILNSDNEKVKNAVLSGEDKLLSRKPRNHGGKSKIST